MRDKRSTLLAILAMILLLAASLNAILWDDGGDPYPSCVKIVLPMNCGVNPARGCCARVKVKINENSSLAKEKRSAVIKKVPGLAKYQYKNHFIREANTPQLAAWVPRM